MPGLSAAGAISTQLEQVQDTIPFLIEKNDVLDRYIQDNGRAKKVSTKSFRVVMQTAMPGEVSKINLDSAAVALPAGGSSEWNQGTVTPLAFCVPIEWTKLAELAAQGDVAVTNTVSTQLGQATDSLRTFRNIFLQTDGTGKIATISAVDGPNRTFTLSSTPFGGRLCRKNQTVMVFVGNVLRGTCQIQRVNKALGGTQTIVVDAVPAGTVANDVIRINGVEDGGPIFVNGIPVFHQTAAVGTTLGIDRAVNNFVIANGVDAGAGQITQPLLLVPFNQVRQELGDEGLKDLLIHTHTAQTAAYQEMGWQLQMIQLEGGKAGDMDLLFKGKKSIEGRAILEDIHAATDRWDYMNIKAWGKVKWGNPPFWFTQEGRRVFEIYAANGSPTAGARSFLVDAYQNFCDNMKSISSITNCKVPSNY
jgi:hypothetical protein